MIKTLHLQMTRGSTKTVTRIARNEKNQPIDLTNAAIYLAMRADIKVDPTVKLTSDDTPPATWRTGITISNQSTNLGEYTFTIIPADTQTLVALGHDDPWLYDVKIKLESGEVVQDITLSNVDLYPQSTDIPA
jgi:hypothetical protein